MGKDVVGVTEGALDPVGSADGELVGAMLGNRKIMSNGHKCKRKQGCGGLACVSTSVKPDIIVHTFHVISNLVLVHN